MGESQGGRCLSDETAWLSRADLVVLTASLCASHIRYAKGSMHTANRTSLIRRDQQATACFLLQSSFPGTLFRLPLRLPSAAASSSIKSSPTTTHQALALLESLQQQLPQALLFLKSVREVEVRLIGTAAADQETAGGGGGGEARVLFRATAQPLDGEKLC